MTYEPLFRRFPRGRWTYGDIAAKVGADLGLVPDAEQAQILDAIYAERAPDVPASFEVVVVSPRQNIKTSTLGIAALADLYVFGVQKHIWTAHLDDTAGETFADLKTLIGRNPDYDELTQFYEGHQDRSIVHRETGAKIDFGSRTGKVKRGYAGVERVTMDEGLYLQPSHLGAVYPTMITKPGAQVRIGSSAGLVGSESLRSLRDRGRRGKDPRLAYVEYGAPFRLCDDDKCLHTPGTPGCALDDRELWWAANCALWAGRITEDSMQNQRTSLPPDEFKREFLSWWEDPPSLGGAISPDWWAAAEVSDLVQVAVPVIGLAGTPDGMYGAIGTAADVGDGRYVIAGVDRRRGQAWLVDEAKRIQDEHGCDVLVDRKGPLSYLFADLDDAEVRVTPLEASDWVDACGVMWSHLKEGTVSHPVDGDLTDAALAAAWRKVGDRRAFERVGRDIALFEACTIALWGASDMADYDLRRSVY